MTKNNMKFRQLLTRCTAVPVAFVGLALNAFADNTVTINDFSIKLGEEVTLDVNLENSDPMSALQMDIALPEGLEYVENSLVRNEARLDREIYSVAMRAYNGKYRLLIVPMESQNFEGNSGAVVSFKVRLAENLKEDKDINITNIVGSSSDIDPETQLTPVYNIADATTDVMEDAYGGTVAMSSEAIELKTEIEKVREQIQNIE